MHPPTEPPEPRQPPPVAPVAGFPDPGVAMSAAAERSPGVDGRGLEALEEYRELLKKVRADYADPARHIELGRFYLRFGHRSRAYGSFRAAKALRPRNEVPYLWLGRLYREDGDLADARDTYLQLLGYAPEHPRGHLELGRVYKQLGEIARAVSSLGEAARLDPDSIDAYELLAELALETDEVERAVGYLNHLKALKPRDPRVFELSARAHLARESVDRAILDLRKALDLRPDAEGPRTTLAKLYLDEDLPDRSLEVLGPLISGGAPGLEALLLGAEARERLAEPDEAEALLIRAQKLPAEDGRASLRRARLRARAGDLVSAAEQYRRAFHLRPADPTPLLELVSQFEEAGDLDAARRVLSELDALHPDRAEVAARRARLEEDAGDLEAALAAYAVALERDETHAPLYRARARLRLRAGKLDLALADLERAREIDPEGADSGEERELLAGHENHRKAYELQHEAAGAMARGDFRAALAHHREIVELVPDNPRWLGDLADLARLAGELDEALARFRDLATLAPDDHRASRSHADLAYRLGRYDEAGKAYERLVEHDPRDLGARLRVLRTLRHKLVDRLVPPDIFQALEEAYRDHLEDRAEAPRTRLELAHLHMGMGSHLFAPKIWVSAAESHLEAIHPGTDVDLRRRAAMARLELARVTDDADSVEKAALGWADDQPEDADACHAHVLALRGCRKPRAERVAAAAYAERHPEDGRFHEARYRALSEELEGAPDRGERLAERVRELQRAAAAERTPGAFMALGFAHLRCHDPAARLESLNLASAAFKKAADLSPDNPWPWWGGVLAARAHVEAARGGRAARERARAACEAAVRRFPRDQALLLELGRLLLGDDDPVARREGRKVLERCLAQGPRPYGPAHADLGRLAEAEGARDQAYHHYLSVFEDPEGLPEDHAVLGRLRSLVPE